MSTASVILDSIRRREIEQVFCVPGESYLAVMDAFYGSPAPSLVATRHEEGAGLMADAYAKATGKTGVCMVTRGPGLTHLSIALHTALQDSTPMVALVGQVPTAFRYREAFQEMDIVAYGRAVAKAALEIPTGDRTAELIEQAFHLAESGRPGPVVVSLPEDVDRAALEPTRIPRPCARFASQPPVDGIAAVAKALSLAEYPVIVAGGGVTRSSAVPELVRLADALGAGVYTAWRRFDAFPNTHPAYLGPMALLPGDLTEPLRRADVVVAVGTRLGEYTTASYKWPAEGQKLIHIDANPETAGGGFCGADIAIAADPGATLAALLDAVAGLPIAEKRARHLAEARQHYVSRTTPRGWDGRIGEGEGLDLEGVYADLLKLVPSESSVSCDAGTFGGWLMRFWRWTEPRSFFAPTAGGMGYAVPAAIAARIARPEHPSIAFAGDGGFAMTMSEIETAVRLGLDRTVALVFNNSNYGTISVHQDREFPGRRVATSLGYIDFAATAASMGALGLTVRRNGELREAYGAAIEAGRPAVINLVYDAGHRTAWQEG